MPTKKNYAFISYSHRDLKIAKWLHKKLESYKLPTEIHNEFEDSKYLRPIFRDQEDLNTGILNDELRKNLNKSKYLVVICSKNSAESEWVSNEVQAFIEWGRLEFIIPFIIEDIPDNDNINKFYPKSLRQHIKAYPKLELLGINIIEVGRDKAFIKVVSRMLGISFDELWKRHERERKRRILTKIFTIPTALSLLYYFAVPTSLTVKFNDEFHHLPLPESTKLTVNNTEYTIKELDTIFTIKNLPGYYRGDKLHIRFSPKWYIPVNENVQIDWGINSFFEKKLQRDNSFAIFAGKVIENNGTPISKATICIDGEECETDDSGKFSITFPVLKQSETKNVQITKDGYNDYKVEDECPGINIIYILRRAIN